MLISYEKNAGLFGPSRLQQLGLPGCLVRLSFRHGNCRTPGSAPKRPKHPVQRRDVKSCEILSPGQQCPAAWLAEAVPLPGSSTCDAVPVLILSTLLFHRDGAAWSGSQPAGERQGLGLHLVARIRLWTPGVPKWLADVCCTRCASVQARPDKLALQISTPCQLNGSQIAEHTSYPSCRSPRYGMRLRPILRRQLSRPQSATSRLP